MAEKPANESTRLVRNIALTLVERGVSRHNESTARHVLRHTAGGVQLLGIDIDEPTAVCFDPVHCCIYRIPISPLGVHPTRSAVEWGSVADPRSWIDACGGTLAWVHPRYRNHRRPNVGQWRYRVETCPITPNI